jgi:hypothetical protein
MGLCCGRRCVVGEENVKKIRRKDVFGGIFASTVSLSIFGWLGNPHDIIRSRTGKPVKISTLATHVLTTACSQCSGRPGLCTAASGKTALTMYSCLR